MRGITHFVGNGRCFVRARHKTVTLSATAQTVLIRGVIVGVCVRGLVMNEGESEQPTIFLVEEDEETRRPLVSNLRSYGYRVIVAVDEEDALKRVGVIEADLILVNLVGKTAEDVMGVGMRVRRHSKYNGRTSLVVMPEKYAKELEDTEVNVAADDWVYYLGEEPDRLRGLPARLTA
jgi:CheY-like chemotaxis protein